MVKYLNFESDYMKRTLTLSILLLCFFAVSAQKVGLVFSGGGAKGLAHIGVLKALEENSISIDYIVGTSMGGIVAGMYASGYTAAEIETIALSEDFQPDYIIGTNVSSKIYNNYFKDNDEKLMFNIGF